MKYIKNGYEKTLQFQGPILTLSTEWPKYEWKETGYNTIQKINLNLK